MDVVTEGLVEVHAGLVGYRSNFDHYRGQGLGFVVEIRLGPLRNPVDAVIEGFHRRVEAATCISIAVKLLDQFLQFRECHVL